MTWIAGITRGHNGAVCLLKDGKIAFAIEEERLSRSKYDGAPLLGLSLIQNYTSTIDFLVINGSLSLDNPLQPNNCQLDWTNENVYVGYARKLGLLGTHDISSKVFDFGSQHHKMHAACAFYRSGFDKAIAVITDGAGSHFPGPISTNSLVSEVETILECSYPHSFKPLYKHLAGNGPFKNITTYSNTFNDTPDDSSTTNSALLKITASAGIVKAYEAVTEFCGWGGIEAGKTMGLSPYGKPNSSIPPIYTKDKDGFYFGNKSMFSPNYPRGAILDNELSIMSDTFVTDLQDVTTLQDRRDMAYAVQKESQEAVLSLILKAVEMSGIKNVVLSGGYGLNCVANYFYLEKLNELGINFYVEPVSSDAGLSIGAALYTHHKIEKTKEPAGRNTNLYSGIRFQYSSEVIKGIVSEFNGAEALENIHSDQIAQILRDKNIVALFQGSSEIGPRALGNRSILFDPTFKDGKDFVNSVKHREYFRPFAGSILHEHVNEWFDMRGLEESPNMMYAVNCQQGVEEKIPSIIHIDGTCRIQTVKEYQNPLFYELISEFYKLSGVPILFNTSFNLGGDPMVESLHDAIGTLIHSDIEYLYLPEYKMLITVQNQTKEIQ